MTTLIKNGKVVFPSGVKTASILIKDGKIAQIGDISAAADEVIDAVAEVGAAMSKDLRETGIGGLAGTPTGQKIREIVTMGQQ